jgi:hypothetical protein
MMMIAGTIKQRANIIRRAVQYRRLQKDGRSSRSCFSSSSLINNRFSLSVSIEDDDEDDGEEKGTSKRTHCAFYCEIGNYLLVYGQVEAVFAGQGG